MTATVRRERALASSPPLPSICPQAITKDRQIVDTTGDTWRFRASDDGGRSTLAAVPSGEMVIVRPHAGRGSRFARIPEH